MYTRDIIPRLGCAREIGLQIRRRERWAWAWACVCGVHKPVRTAIRLGVKRSDTPIQ